jgi:hypothetical protein
MKATAKKVRLAKVRARADHDSFEAVAKRLQCDPDLNAFDAKLKKIVKMNASTLKQSKVRR